MNEGRIEIMFQLAGVTTFIDYIPASWPKPDTALTTPDAATGRLGASSNNRFERSRVASSVGQGGSR